MGKIGGVLFILLFHLNTYSYQVCYNLFQHKNLTVYSKELQAYSFHQAKEILLNQGGRWLPISSNIISHVRYRVWQPRKKKVKYELLLIGGLGQTTERFDQNPEFMKKLMKAGIKVIFLELPGQGHTSLLYELENGNFQRLHSEDMFPVVDNAIAQLKTNKVITESKIHMAGHSYGGWFLTEYLYHSRRQDVDKVILLDPGVKSFHNEGIMKWLDPVWSLNPFYKHYRDQYLSYFLKQVLKKDQEHYKNDPVKLNYASALYLGIMNRSAIEKAPSFPLNYKMKVLVAEKTEFGPQFKSMISSYYQRLKNPQKDLVEIEGSPHNVFSYTPAAKHIVQAILN